MCQHVFITNNNLITTYLTFSVWLILHMYNLYTLVILLNSFLTYIIYTHVYSIQLIPHIYNLHTRVFRPTHSSHI